MRHLTRIVLCGLVALALHAPEADARLFPNDDRKSLIAEAAWATWQGSVRGDNIQIVNREGDWRYVESDFPAFLVLAHSPLGASKPSFITKRNGFQSFHGWSNEAILRLVENAGPGWGGQCLSFVSLLLYRAGCTDAGTLLLSYKQLGQSGIVKNVHDARPGDIAFRAQYHAGVVLQVRGDGLLIGDSNWSSSLDEKIRMHQMSWAQLSGFQVADLDKLLRSLGARR